jgi:hypothetical protein
MRAITCYGVERGATGGFVMTVGTAAYIRKEDGQEFIGSIIEYEGKLWLVPEWLEGPTAGTRCPARIICTDGLSLTKAASGSPADFVLAMPLNKDILEGRKVSQNPSVIERPDIYLRVDQDFLRRNPKERNVDS